jgi:hypothetical protein
MGAFDFAGTDGESNRVKRQKDSSKQLSFSRGVFMMARSLRIQAVRATLKGP